MRKAILLGLVVFISANVVGETVYFLVGEIDPFHNDSYVLPLTDPNDIAHARALLKFGHNIIVANIECCSCSINRDYLSPGKTLWQWRVTEFLGFAEITAEILDGWPGFVNADCAGWTANTGGTIGFWNYTIVAELGTNPEHWRCNLAGDARVDLSDYAALSEQWLSVGCDEPDWCGGGAISAGTGWSIMPI